MKLKFEMAYKLKSWEFPNGTCFSNVENPVNVPVKLIHDAVSHKIYCFSKAMENGIIHLKQRYFSNQADHGFYHVKCWEYAAARVCIYDGEYKCLKSRFTLPETENAKEIKEILDIGKSTLKFAIETGLEPYVESDEKILNYYQAQFNLL